MAANAGNRKFSFSKERIDRLPIPEKRTYYYDAKVPGLALSVTPTGSKSFYFIRWLNGKTAFAKLENGTYPAMTPEQARATVARLNGEAATGVDPVEVRRERRAEMTLLDAFERWSEHGKQHKRSWEQDRAIYRRYLEGWGSRKLSQLTRRKIVDWHRATGERHGVYAANAALRMLRAMLNWIVRSHDLTLDNPATGVKLFPEQKRESWIDAATMPRLLDAIEADQNPDMRDFFLLCLLTGARRGNVQAMRWDDVDLSGGTWTIPGSAHKTKRPLTIPLATPALTLLQARLAFHGFGVYVFPSTGKSGHLEEPKTAWKRVLSRVGLEGLRIHDLRHTAASWLANQGAPLTLIGAALGHTQPSTTSRYAHLATDPVRQALERSGNAILATRNPSAEVVPLLPTSRNAP